MMLTLLRFLSMCLVITYRVDGTATVTPKVQIVTAGQPAVFNCSIIKDSNSGEVQWSMIDTNQLSKVLYKSSPPAANNSRYFVDTPAVGVFNLVINVTQITDSGSYYCKDNAFQASTLQQIGQLLVLGSFTVSQNVSNNSVILSNDSVQTICSVSPCADNGLGNGLIGSFVSIVVTLSMKNATNGQLTVVNSSSLNNTLVVLQHNYVPNSCDMPTYECSVTGTTVQENTGKIIKYTDQTTVLCPVRSLVITPSGSNLTMYINEFLTCFAQGSSSISYQWFNMSGNSSSPLSPGPALFSTSVGVFRYQCTASNMVQNIPYSISSDLIMVTVTACPHMDKCSRSVTVTTLLSAAAAGADENKTNIIIGVVVGVGSLIVILIVIIIVIACIKQRKRKELAAENKYEDVTAHGFESDAVRSTARKGKPMNSGIKGGPLKKGVVEESLAYEEIPASGGVDSYAKGHPISHKVNDIYDEIQIQENRKEIPSRENNEYAEANVVVHPPTEGPSHSPLLENPTVPAGASPTATSPFDITLIENTLYAETCISPPTSPGVELGQLDRRQKGSYNKTRALPPSPAVRNHSAHPFVEDSAHVLGDSESFLERSDNACTEAPVLSSDNIDSLENSLYAEVSPGTNDQNSSKLDPLERQKEGVYNNDRAHLPSPSTRNHADFVDKNSPGACDDSTSSICHSSTSLA